MVAERIAPSSPAFLRDGIQDDGAKERVEIKRKKGIWWMPWRQEAMKDVARCDKLRGVASKL
jgi:hypothetical protein